MKEKNDELINNLLRLKFNWWNQFWGRLIKIVKVKSKDSLYQEYLDSIRKDVVKRNSEEDGKEDAAYQVYIDLVNDYLKTSGKRLLTEKEEGIVVAHLMATALTFCNDPCSAIRGVRLGKVGRVGEKDVLGITQVLSIETAKKVCELHPDCHTPTKEQIDQRVEEVLAIQNYLEDELVNKDSGLHRENEKKEGCND